MELCSSKKPFGGHSFSAVAFLFEVQQRAALPIIKVWWFAKAVNHHFFKESKRFIFMAPFSPHRHMTT